MSRSPLSLAAIASAALPDHKATAVREVELPGDFDGAEVTFADQSRVIVQAPRTVAASVNQEAELNLLADLAHLAEAGKLPFQVPTVLGSLPLETGGRAIVTTPLVGSPIRLDALNTRTPQAANVGRAIAAIHELAPATLERLGFPSYSADEYHGRHLRELEETAATGMVPPVLVDRWRAALNDGKMWQFTPAVLHGDLAEEYLLVDQGQVASISGWGNARVADPADDLAWLLAAVNDDVGETLLMAYQANRSGPVDPYLLNRAMFLGELALARWLQFGLREQLPEVVADATAMLSELAAAVS